MARTLEAIATELRSAHPQIRDLIGGRGRIGELVALDAKEYEARIAEWARNLHEGEVAADAAKAIADTAATKASRAQTLLDKLGTGTQLTPAEQREVWTFTLERVAGKATLPNAAAVAATDELSSGEVVQTDANTGTLTSETP